MRPLILASVSPRRKTLLAECGYPDFTVVPSAATELEPAPDNAEYLALENAVRKAADVSARYPEAVVIGADTVIEFERGIIGKPADAEDAVRILMRLSGRTHLVTTAVCVRCAENNVLVRFVESSEVRFRDFGHAVAEEYVRLVNVLDKAGAYAVQEHGELIIAGTRGSYTNIVGLPAERLKETLDCVFAIGGKN